MTLESLAQFAVDVVPWEIIIVIAATIIASVSPFAAYQYYRRPKPVTGILPRDEVRHGQFKLDDLGAPAPGEEIRFRKSALAPEITSHDQIGNIDLLETTRRFVLNDGMITVPIVFQNRGHRDMREYKVTVTFESDGNHHSETDPIEIREVHTETLSIDGLFCDPNTYDGADTDRIPHRSIVRMYEELGLPGNFVSLTGSLGSGTMESMILELWCPNGVEAFFLIIELDSPEWFVGEKIFCQRVEVVDNLGTVD